MSTMFNRWHTKVADSPLQKPRTEFKSQIICVDNGDKDSHTFVDGCDDIEIALEGKYLACRDGGSSNKSRERWRTAKANRVVLASIFLYVCFLFLGNSLPKLNGKFDGSQQSGSSDSSKLTHGERYKILQSPDGWETLSYGGIRRHFNCKAHAHDQSKPLHSQEEWQFIREKYNGVVDDRVKFDDPMPPTLGYTLRDQSPPPFFAKFSPGKGRGVFASRDIKKGELVHDGNRSASQFSDGMAWRRFVFSLPREMACDIAEWSWTQSLSVQGRLEALVDLNIAAFFNTGGEMKSNVNPKVPTSLKFYATRDIKKGSELLYDYNLYETNWEKVGL